MRYGWWRVNDCGDVSYCQMDDPVSAKLLADWPPEQWEDVTVVLAVSGGPDSVCLLRCARQLKRAGAGQLVVAHFNHRLRGEESEQDQTFVERLSAELQLPCLVDRASHENKIEATAGVEDAARRQRYRFLTEAARQVGARFVATAHTASDQVETIVHRIVRGTGLTGLAGIPRTRPLSEGVTLIRPLLDVSREEVLQCLERIGQPFREDRSNRDLTATRNRIRHQLLPQLAEFNPAVGAALLRLGSLAADAQSALTDLAESLAQQSVLGRERSEIVISTAPLQGAPQPIVRQMLVQVWAQNGWPLQAMSYDKWEQLATFVRQVDPGGALNLPGDVVVKNRDGRVTLRRGKAG